MYRCLFHVTDSLTRRQPKFAMTVVDLADTLFVATGKATAALQGTGRLCSSGQQGSNYSWKHSARSHGVFLFLVFVIDAVRHHCCCVNPITQRLLSGSSVLFALRISSIGSTSELNQRDEFSEEVSYSYDTIEEFNVDSKAEYTA